MRPTLYTAPFAFFTIMRSVHAEPIPAQDADSPPVEQVALDQKVEEKITKDSAGFRLFGEPALLTGPLISDRPDFTESPQAVPRGHFQLEMGYTYTYDREDEESTQDHTTPEILMRIGVVDRLELRIGWAGYSFQRDRFEFERREGRTETRDVWSQGNNDLSLGFKYQLYEQDGIRPALGVLAGLSVPSGSAEFSAGDVEPEAILAWAYDVTEWLAIAGNVGVLVRSDDGRDFLQTSAAITSVFSVTERLGAYVEYFGFYPAVKDSDAAHSINGGFTYLITDNFQIDIRAGFGLNETADDFFTGIGFVWRW